MDDSKEKSDAVSTTPKIDWSLAPANARWWAIDEDGAAYWYCAPRVAALTSFWFCDQIPAPAFDYAGDWRKSLAERG